MPLSEIISIVIYVNALLVIFILIYEERDPSTTLAWTMALVLVPVAGLVAYLLIGRNWRAIAKRDVKRLQAEARGAEMLAPVYERWEASAREVVAGKPAFIGRLAHAIERQNGTKPLPCTGLEIFASGADKFPRLFADIEAAEESVHLEYFIWENDELTGRLCDLLARKVADGVYVRVLYDWVGSLPYKKEQLKRLEAAGAQVHADAANWSKFNYRNHRKISVIDGRIGYTGGMNMGQEYIDGLPRYASWRDTHVRFTGPLVAEMQRLFAERWFRVCGEDLFAPRYFPELDIDNGGRVVWAQMAHSGPESDYEALRNAFLLGIMSAERRVRVQSPYFVPDEAILESLVTQSLAGVDVRFMMTGVPDKKIAWNAAFSYIDELVDGGGRMLQYDAGFFHAKAMTVDGELCIIGTTNFDIRSFMLHDELSLFFYDPQTAEEQDRIFAEDEKHCHEITCLTYDGFSRTRKLGNALARLWSRLL